MRPRRGQRRRSGIVHTVLHHGREFSRHADACVRHFGPTIKMAAMAAAPALANAGLPQTAATTAVIGQAMDGYSQLRSQLPEKLNDCCIYHALFHCLIAIGSASVKLNTCIMPYDQLLWTFLACLVPWQTQQVRLPVLLSVSHCYRNPVTLWATLMPSSQLPQTKYTHFAEAAGAMQGGSSSRVWQAFARLKKLWR